MNGTFMVYSIVDIIINEGLETCILLYMELKHVLLYAMLIFLSYYLATRKYLYYKLCKKKKDIKFDYYYYYYYGEGKYIYSYHHL